MIHWSPQQQQQHDLTWLPNENKGRMYIADTHHQSHIAHGHNHYLLYVNPFSNKAGYPLMRCHCCYCGGNMTSKCHRPTANDWLCPTETWWWNPRLRKSSGSANDVSVFCPHLLKWAKVRQCWENNESLLAIWYVLDFYGQIKRAFNVLMFVFFYRLTSTFSQVDVYIYGRSHLQ